MPEWPAEKLQLACFPDVPDHVSLPWDSADEYLLREADTTIPTATLILNDRHGALYCALPGAATWSDSFCARQAAQNNARANDLHPPDFLNYGGFSSLTNIRQVLIQIPKQKDQLADQLRLVATHCPDANVFLAGMAKHIPISLLNWLEVNADEYTQPRIVKKARLLNIRGLTKFASMERSLRGYTVDGLTLNGLPGVFSRDHLDPGAEVFRQYLPDLHGKVICDLGCGNGILAISLAKASSGCTIIATDDSELATLATKANAKLNDLVTNDLVTNDLVTNNSKTNNSEIDVRHGNALSAVTEKLDYVFCNPPFHDGNKQLTNIALNMFSDAHKQLKGDGVLLVVANRHLPYTTALKKLFRRVRLISDDKRFNVYYCTK